MQAVFDLPLGSKPTLMQFAGGRNYMMRSEKRRSSNVPTGSSGKRPRRRPRRRRAGFFYKLLTILLLVVLWPVGLLLLWRRKLRWGVGTKLLASVVTLITCIILVGFALTVQTDNPKYTAIQDSVNSFLDEAADALIETSGVVADKAVEIGGNIADFGDALWKKGSVLLADGIDAGVNLADSIKADIKGMLRTGEADPTATPETTSVPTDEPTDAPTDAPTQSASEAPAATEGAPGEDASTEPSVEPSEAATSEASSDPTAKATSEAGIVLKPVAEEPTDAPSDEPTDAPSAEPPQAVSEAPTAEPTSEPTAEPTDAPTQEPTAEPAIEVKPASAGVVYIPQTHPTAGTQLRGGMLDRNGVLTEGEIATPEPEVPVFTVKSAKEATVYYNTNGRFYHMASTCVGMTSANPHSFLEAIEDGLGMCANCNSPDPMLLAKYIVWTDETGIAHLSDNCPSFSGKWKLQSANDALSAETLGCRECDADAYLAAIAEGREIRIEAEIAPAAVPTLQPASAPTEAPAEPAVIGMITPTVALKPAGLATVYHTPTGSWYHMAPVCTNMTGATPYTLESCVSGSKVYKTCRTCSAPKADLVDENCLWMDEADRFHTTDECVNFNGRYTLVPRDEALQQNGLKACPNCGAEQYIIPGTQIAYIPYVAPGEAQ